MGLLGSLASKGMKVGSKVANAPASGSVAGEAGKSVGGGPYASAAGAAADIGIDGAAGAMSRTGTIGGGLSSGILGHAAFSAGQTLGERMGGTRTDATVDAENREKAGQSVAENVGEFLLSPGQTVDRLQTGWRGMAKDVQGAYDDQQKTNRMETNRKMSRPMSKGYTQNVNQLQGLMSRR